MYMLYRCGKDIGGGGYIERSCEHSIHTGDKYRIEIHTDLLVPFFFNFSFSLMKSDQIYIVINHRKKKKNNKLNVLALVPQSAHSVLKYYKKSVSKSNIN